jgi:hypothetical protein
MTRRSIGGIPTLLVLYALTARLVFNVTQRRTNASMNFTRRFFTAALVFLCGGLPVHAANIKTFETEIANGAVVGKKSVRVTRGDTVILRWKSDKPLELHLHGYDVTTRVTPGAPAEMKVSARATGRFPVEVHVVGARGGHAHKPIFHLEVYPE